MRAPFVLPPRSVHRQAERGVTMVLVALAMVAIIAMAALSIDVITLYLAKEEAQRSADAAALAGAKVLSLSGITGDPSNSSTSWSAVCGGSTSVATEAAQAVARQNAVGGRVGTTITVTYSAPGGAPVADCTSLTGSNFRVNPLVTVQIQQTSLPAFFSRVWGNRGSSVSATATAEAFNPANSSIAGLSTITPVQPRCVKPWAVANQNPLIPPPNPNYCNTAGGPGSCHTLVNLPLGSITDPGIALNGGDGTHLIGETFWLGSNCQHTNPSSCNPLRSPIPPIPSAQANLNQTVVFRPPQPNLLFLPNQVGTPVTAVPSCSTAGDIYEQAVAGCDAPTNYQCGVAIANTVDLGRNPDYGSTTNGVSCLIHQTDTNNVISSSGQDFLTTTGGFGDPSAYPFQIQSGTSNPLAISGAVSTSSSIVSLPIYDDKQPGLTITPGATTNVTFVGFLQVFINAVDQYGNMKVTVLNVTGCGNGTNATGAPVSGSSPVPVRLITPP